MLEALREGYASLYAIIWDEKKWFPPGVNWTTLKSTDGEKYPDFEDMYYPIAYAFVVLVLRTIFEWSIARPLGRYCGINDTGSELPNFFKRLYQRICQLFALGQRKKSHSTSQNSNSNPSQKQKNNNPNLSQNSPTKTLNDSTKQNGSASPHANGDHSHSMITTTEVSNGRILKNRKINESITVNGHASNVSNGIAEVPKGHRNPTYKREVSSRPKRRLVVPKSTLDKFSESCWRCFYYFFIFVYGIFILWDKPWFWDTAHCWYGYPFQTIDNDVWWLYMIEASFYWSLTFSQFVDVYRKDFAMNFVHHVATIALLWFSWADNFVRVGTLVLVIHDAADAWLEGAKMARYCKRISVCNFLFGGFLLVWMVTRLGLYPFRIIYSTLIEAPSLVGFYAAYYVFNTLLLVLQVLHILWSIMIFKVAITAITTQETDDVRSDDEDDGEEYVEETESENEEPELDKEE